MISGVRRGVEQVAASEQVRPGGSGGGVEWCIVFCGWGQRSDMELTCERYTGWPRCVCIYMVSHLLRVPQISKKWPAVGMQGWGGGQPALSDPSPALPP